MDNENHVDNGFLYFAQYIDVHLSSLLGPAVIIYKNVCYLRSSAAEYNLIVNAKTLAV